MSQVRTLLQEPIGVSPSGKATDSDSVMRRFESPTGHHGRLAQLGERLPYKQNVSSSILLSPTIMKSSTCSAPWDFLLPFPFFLYSHITSCIRDSLHFVRRFAPSKCVRCGTSSILLSPTKKKASCASRRDAFFLALSLPPYLSFNLLHPRSRSFARRFAPSNDVRCGTSSILLSPTIIKSSTCSAPWDFLLPFLLRSG